MQNILTTFIYYGFYLEFLPDAAWRCVHRLPLQWNVLKIKLFYANVPRLNIIRLRSFTFLLCSGKSPPSMSHSRRMHYLRAFIEEVFRFKTVLPLGIPHRTNQKTVLCGYDIPQDTIVSTTLSACSNKLQRRWLLKKVCWHCRLSNPFFCSPACVSKSQFMEKYFKTISGSEPKVAPKKLD